MKANQEWTSKENNMSSHHKKLTLDAEKITALDGVNVVDISNVGLKLQNNVGVRCGKDSLSMRQPRVAWYPNERTLGVKSHRTGRHTTDWMKTIASDGQELSLLICAFRSCEFLTKGGS